MVSSRHVGRRRGGVDLGGRRIIITENEAVVEPPRAQVRPHPPHVPEHGPVGPVRRAISAGLVRLGLRLGYDGHVPPLVSQLSRREEAPTGVSTRSPVSLPNFRAGVTRS